LEGKHSSIVRKKFIEFSNLYRKFLSSNKIKWKRVEIPNPKSRRNIKLEIE